MKDRDIYGHCRLFSKEAVRALSSLKVGYLHRPITLQLLRSATSVAANMMEVSESVSKKDFINKLGIALKEAKESIHWIELLVEYYENKDLLWLSQEAEALVKILSTIKRKYLTSEIIG